MMILFTSSFRSSDPRRQAELDQVARRNLASGLFHRFVDVQPSSGADRPTFADFFAATVRVAGPDDTCVISNSDIFFDRTLRRAERIPSGRWCLALSRWDWTGKAMTGRPWRGQDAWVFRGPVTGVSGADFGMGIPACDNRLAALVQDSGYTVTNPAYSIHAIHLHLSAVRTYGPATPAIPGPYLWVPAGDLAGRIDKTPDEYAAFAEALQDSRKAISAPAQC